MIKCPFDSYRSNSKILKTLEQKVCKIGFSETFNDLLESIIWELNKATLVLCFLNLLVTIFLFNGFVYCYNVFRKFYK